MLSMSRADAAPIIVDTGLVVVLVAPLALGQSLLRRPGLQVAVAVGIPCCPYLAVTVAGNIALVVFEVLVKPTLLEYACEALPLVEGSTVAVGTFAVTDLVWCTPCPPSPAAFQDP